ncbi:DUF2256 domain-containing protein [Oceanicaulis sp. LC35]|uniref:DUF2256 domain-containing protein n=1 Tax=Oceanicaulis sp. LC35 TaxID=3349635 RepID=UPI003F843955
MKGPAPRRQKGDLPEKVCPVCERPFSWRKKWERNWESIKYCSRRCASQRQKS